MKKILLTVAGSMFIGLAAVMAQERSDTTKRSGESTQYRTESGTQGETSTIEGKSGTQGQYSWRESDRESLTRDDIPQGLLTTLESDEYQGWENATIYRNKTSGDFMLVIQDNGETRTFYFDKAGSRTNVSDDPNMSQSGQTGVSGQTSSQTDASGQTSSQTGVSGQTSSQTGVSGQTSSQTSGQTSQTTTSGTYDQSSTTNTGVSGDQSGVSVQTEGVSAEMYTEPEWKKSDKVKIRTSQIPSAMLITLGDPMYRGWDNSTVYRNKTTNEYMMEIKKGGDTKVYYFDKEGNAKTAQSNQGTSQDQSSSYNNNQSGTSSTKQTGTTPAQSSYDQNGAPASTSSTATTSQSSTMTSDQDDRAAWKTEDRVMVTSSELPVTLRTTLRDDKYKGWENSSIYRNRNTNEYMVEIRDGSSTQTYYFDKSGSDITTSTYGSGKSDDQSSSYNSSSTTSQSDDNMGNSVWKDDDRIVITIDQVPASLRTTLGDEQYQGWENSSMYRNKSTNEYMIQIKDGSNVKTYYFDKEGKAMTIESDDDDQ